MSANPPPGLGLDRFKKKPAPSPGSASPGGPGFVLVERERRVKEILASIETLPSLPDVMMRILKLANQSDTAASDFEEIVRRDQVLTAKVLKLVNSPFFGLRSEVTTIPQAIVVLGFKTLKSVVLAAKTSDLLDRQLGPYGFEKGGLWKHSLGCAETCQRFARRLGLGKETEEQLFIAGLLHDVGKVILAPHIGREREAFGAALGDSGGDVVRAEVEVLGISHATAGARMAEKWNLPHRLRELIERHHDLAFPGGDRDVDRDLAVVQLADVLCNVDRAGLLPDARPLTDHYPALLEALGWTADREEIEREATTAFGGLQSVFQAMGHE